MQEFEIRHHCRYGALFQIFVFGFTIFIQAAIDVHFDGADFVCAVVPVRIILRRARQASGKFFAIGKRFFPQLLSGIQFDFERRKFHERFPFTACIFIQGVYAIGIVLERHIRKFFLEVSLKLLQVGLRIGLRSESCAPHNT